MNNLFGIKLTGSRLRNKIFARVVLVSLFPLLIASGASFYLTNLSHRNDVASIEDNVVEKTSKEVAKVIDEVENIFELFVPGIDPRTGRPYHNIVGVSTASIIFILDGILMDNQDIQSVSMIDAPSGMLFATRHRGVDELYAPERAMDRLKFFQVAKNGKNYTGPIYFTMEGPMVTVAAPVKNAERNIIGVLMGEVKLQRLQEFIKGVRFGKEGHVYLIDQEGSLIAHGKRSLLEFQNLRSVPLVAEILSGRVFAGLEGQRRYKNFWSEEVIATGQKIEKLGWGIVAEWPIADVNAFLNYIRNLLIGFIFVVIIATLAVSVFLANRIVKPINQLEIASKRISTGVFNMPVSIKTDDEIEELGASFNDMMKDLKKLKELREEFVFIAAHELRTPVTAIKGYVQMVLEGLGGPVGDKAKEFLNQVATANQRLVQLVNDLLEVARSEAGRLTINVKQLAIPPAVESALKELKPLADEKSIRLIYELQEQPNIMADDVRLREVLINLIGNAIKYTIGSGTVAITHEVRNNMLVTNVKDTGIGISSEGQKKLFEKFYRVQTEKTASITGTGLGLFIVKEIIEKMNGSIWVNSEEGKGSTFSFSLPTA